MNMNPSQWLKAVRTQVFAVGVVIGMACGTAPALAQSDASLALSALPLASAVAGASLDGAQGAVGLPLALSQGGGQLVVKAVNASANGTGYVLERVSDGAMATVNLSANAVGAVSVGVGTVVESSAMGAGVILSVAGEVLAFIPNAVGEALLHNERL